MRNILFIFVLLSFLTFGVGVLAQDSDLPEAGITPDSPFYFLKSWKESIQLFFTFGEENKAKQFLHLSEVRLAEYQKMVEKGKTEIAQKTLEKYEKQLSYALEKAEGAEEKGKNVEKLKEEIGEKILKHQEVLEGVLEKVPDEAKSGIEKAIEMSKKGFEEAIKAVSGAKKEELQRKAEEIKVKIEEKIEEEDEVLKEIEAPVEEELPKEEGAPEEITPEEKIEEVPKIGEEFVPTCPASCDDGNPCTRDFCSKETNYRCIHKNLSGAQIGCSGGAGICRERVCSSGACIIQILDNCCGNDKCEAGETYLTCPSDCLETPQAILEENIPEIKDYPKLEQVFIDLYVPFKFMTGVGFNYSECRSGYFTEEEIEFMKMILEIYKENPKLKDYPRDALYYFASWSSGDTTYYDLDFFSNTLRKKALSLKGEDDLTTAENIYEFVNNYISETERIYKYTSAHSLDEVETIWQYKVGKCEEKAYLMTALLKSVGIPTRIVDSALPPHKWTEIYSNNQWVPIPSTGALDYDKDKKVDFREDMVLDVAITYDLSKTRLLDCVPLVLVPRSFIGYKYTSKFTEALLKLAGDNEFKNTALDYVSRWKATRIWKEREEFGKIAFENSVASIFGEKKAIYTWIDLDLPFGRGGQDKSKLFPESEMVVIGLESHYKMENTSSFFRELMRLNTSKKINFIVIKEDLSEAVLFDANDMAQLSEMSDDFKRGSYLDSLLNQFVEAIKKVEKGELSETNFLLPAVDYDVFVSAIGPIKEEGYEYTPYLKTDKEIRGVVFEFRTEYPQAEFRYIKFVNKNGEIILEPKSSGYYGTCPSNLRISFEQTLNIKKEGNYVVIKGDMSLEE